MKKDPRDRRGVPMHWSIEQRMEFYTDKSGGPNACWIWRGPLCTLGYSRVKYKGVNYSAYRLAYAQAKGPIPKGKKRGDICVCHNCPGGDNPACVNPAHLWLGTKSQNTRDRDSKGRQARGERNGRAVLSDRQVLTIRKSSALQRDLAKKYKVHPATIGRARRGERWTHLGNGE